MTDLEARLRRIRTATREGRPRQARDLGARALREARDSPKLAVLAALAARDLRTASASEDLAAGLRAGLGAPEDRVAGWVALAEDADARRLWSQADEAWASACEEGSERQDLLLGRAGALLRAGRTADAEPLLVTVTTGDDTALTLAAWLLLSGIHLAAYRLTRATEAAEKARALAHSRHNWLAFAAAEIDLSEVHVRRQDRAGALDRLLDALRVVRRRGDPGALLVARVHEVRTGA